MEEKYENIVIRFVRALGITLGSIILILCFVLVVFSTEELPSSVFERFCLSISLLIIGIILVLPYKNIKKKALFYLLLSIFIFLLIGIIDYFYRAWVPDSIGSTFKLDEANLLPIGAFVIYIANIWAFLKITRGNINIKRH